MFDDWSTSVKGIETKAVRLVLDGHVTVDLYKTGDDNQIMTAAGHVQSGDETYWVTLDPDGGTCDCTFGVNQPGRLHSHSLALRLAAQQKAKESM